MGFQAIFCLLILTLALTNSLKLNILSFRDAQIINPQAAAQKLQEIIPTNALFETYESDIMFLTPSIQFHCPPDRVSVEAVERITVDPERSLDDDPLLAYPAYLHLGGFNESWGVYNAVVNQDAFRLLESFSGYDLYYRVL
jgi:hypothetical protein